MASETPFGPGTVTIGETGSVFAFECEVTGGSVTHEYTVVETKRKLCGDVVQDRRTRADGVKFNLEDDLTAAGLYARLAALPESPDPETITYVPSTEVGAEWSGSIVPLLPGEIGADEYGKPIASSVEWPAVGLITFTPGTTPAGLVAGKSGKALV
jgi:hypothetical protein